ncbi:MAG: hypothetical protein ABJB98_01920, partial [Actinomycetota bacterium]
MTKAPTTLAGAFDAFTGQRARLAGLLRASTLAAVLLAGAFLAGDLRASTFAAVLLDIDLAAAFRAGALA